MPDCINDGGPAFLHPSLEDQPEPGARMNTMTRTMDVRARRAVRSAFTGWAHVIARGQLVHARLTAGMPPEYRLSDLVIYVIAAGVLITLSTGGFE